MFVDMEDLLIYVALVVVSYLILYHLIQSAVLGALRKFNKDGGLSPLDREHLERLDRLDRENKARQNEDK